MNMDTCMLHDFDTQNSQKIAFVFAALEHRKRKEWEKLLE